ncbi:MAG: glutamyl-tRNA reductase, partial [Selenomonadaceae bacterium]|nr:glutamyl-tRNA reductase [Selenomonadaceae bacterium]
QTQQLMTRRDGRGIVFVDIAVPRDVDPEVGNINGVTLYNIDDLESVVEKNLQARQREAEVAEKIVDEHVAAVMERFKYLKFRPLMANLSERAEKIREREIRRVAGKLPKLSDDERKIVDQMTRRIVRKLLRMPMMKLNASAGTDSENFYAQAVKALFTDEVNYVAQD